METAASNDLNAQYEYREIPLDLIDEPRIPERETMEETDLADLAISIASQGLIKPLVVKQVSDRFETVTGHRRLLGCRLANYSPVPCRVKVGEAVDPLAVLVAENAYVEPVNPVEEARFFQRVLDELCAGDVDVLCLKLRRKRGYVEDRLLMLRGYPRVVDALQRKQISFAAARELNKMADPNRMLIFLDQAVVAGASARQIEMWRKEAEGQAPIELPAGELIEAANGDGVPDAGSDMQCFLCHSSEDPHMLQMVWLHKYCRRMLERGTHPALATPANGEN
jgi:ParB family chromosome partitioning protein